MSTILKALRRVEGDRQEQAETERLQGQLTGGILRETGPSRGWVRGGIGLLLLLVVAGAGFWFGGS